MRLESALIPLKARAHASEVCLPYSPRTKSRLNANALGSRSYLYLYATTFHLWIIVMRRNFFKGLYMSHFGFKKFPASTDPFANISFTHQNAHACARTVNFWSHL
jgi:hypothetical protein